MADTAKLLASLDLQDAMSPKLRSAMGGVSAAEARIGSLGKGVSGLASNLKGNASNAIRTFSGRVTQLGSSLTQLLGIGGLFGIGAVIGKSLQEAANFGANVQNVAKVTGLAIPVASAMVDTLDKWGIASDRLIPLLGKLEKNIGAIAAKKDGLADFRKEFGVALTGSNGKILDANTLLLKSADYFNSSASATQKATFLSKLYGKQWQDLIPILSKGSAFIKAQEKDSIKLTQAQLANITKFRNAQREFADIVGDLEVKIGANIMPLVTTGLKNVGAWLDTHTDDIADFFKGAAETAGQAAGAAIDVFKAVQTGWNSIPEGFRDLLVKGLIADRTVKFLFGFSPLGSAGGLLGAGFGQFFARGSSPANPMFVSGVGIGGVGGIGGATLGLAAAVPVLAAIAAYLAYAKATVPESTYGSTAPGSATNRYGTVPGAGVMIGSSLKQGAQDFARFQAQTALAAAGVHNFADAVAGARAGLAAFEHWATTRLSDRLAASVLPKSEVNAQLRAALRIANSTESTDRKIRELQAIEKDLRTHGHRTSYYVESLLAVERRKKTSVTAITNIRVNASNGTLLRVSTTNMTGGSSTRSGTATIQS